MLLAAENNYPLLEVIWTIIVFFAWVIWIWAVISILSDVFRRHDIGGWGKALWTFVHHPRAVPGRARLSDQPGQGHGRAQRRDACRRRQKMYEQHIREVAGAAAAAARPARSPTPRRCWQRRHHPGGVRAAQAEGARLSASTY